MVHFIEWLLDFKELGYTQAGDWFDGSREWVGGGDDSFSLVGW